MASILPLFFLFLLLASSALASANALKFPKLSVVRKTWKSNSAIAQKILEESISKGYKILNYGQTLDHFDHTPESYVIFQQRYAINYKYWGGAETNSPIFLYTGDESALDGDLQATSFLVDNAAHFKALLVVVEHRYYGESYPFRSMEEAFQNASTLGYFSSSQALADYAEITTSLKKNLSAENCPVIAMGGSYGGMLASWFRLKYPHIAIGALASSAPILYFDDITPSDAYHDVVSKDFKDASMSCYKTIKQSWSEIDKIASGHNGLKILSKRFKTCRPLSNSDELKGILVNIYSLAAQYDTPSSYPVNMICKAIDGATRGTEVLGRIISGIRATDVGVQVRPCLDLGGDDNSLADLGGWNWQTCTELFIPMLGFGNDSMFQAELYDFANQVKSCQLIYGVAPRPHWITMEFGGHNIKTALEKFGSNIIFSNGLRDPYSSGGILQNISDSIVAIHTSKGSHCLDVLFSTPNDPQWLVEQRNAEVKIIEGWIVDYHARMDAKTHK